MTGSSIRIVYKQYVAEELKKGKRALLAKMDVKQAYRHIPVRPSDRHLLGIQWSSELFVDMIFPVGLRSASLLFTAVADAMQWAMEDRWVGHYIDDDFYTLGAAGSHECATSVTIFEGAGLPRSFLRSLIDLSMTAKRLD